jgi:hypothetical protein
MQNNNTLQRIAELQTVVDGMANPPKELTDALSALKADAQATDSLLAVKPEPVQTHKEMSAEAVRREQRDAENPSAAQHNKNVKEDRERQIAAQKRNLH